MAIDSAEHRASPAEYHSRFAAAAFGWTLFPVGRTQSINYELPACCGWSFRTCVYCTLPGAQMSFFLALCLAFVRRLRFFRVRALKLKSDVLGMVMDGMDRYAKDLRNSGLRQFGIEQSFDLAFSSREFGTGQSVKPWHISMRTDRRVALGGPFNAIFATQRTMILGTFAARCFTAIRDVLAIFTESHSLNPARIRQATPRLERLWLFHVRALKRLWGHKIVRASGSRIGQPHLKPTDYVRLSFGRWRIPVFLQGTNEIAGNHRIEKFTVQRDRRAMTPEWFSPVAKFARCIVGEYYKPMAEQIDNRGSIHIRDSASARARRQGPGVPVPSGKRQNTIIALGVFNGG